LRILTYAIVWQAPVVQCLFTWKQQLQI